MTDKQFRLYVVFEEDRKVKTREIFIADIHLANIDIREQECLNLLKGELDLTFSDKVHGAVYIGKAPAPVTLKYLHSEDLYGVYVESLRQRCQDDLCVPSKEEIKERIEAGEVYSLKNGEYQTFQLSTTQVSLLSEDEPIPALKITVLESWPWYPGPTTTHINYPAFMFEQVFSIIATAEGERASDIATTGFTDYEILLATKDTIHCGSHYDYLDAMLNPFWMRVFGKIADDMWCGGIVTAHGDKCYGYKRRWAAKGINFYHGAMLYLLTYTRVMDQEKYLSGEWVIENYLKYLPVLEAAEKEVMDRLREKINLT
jgi:hypothetical protein